MLPPSETKRSGGTGLPLSQVALTFPSLEPARTSLFERLGLDLEQPTLPAYLRYDGVLYREFKPDSLQASEIAVLREKFLIQSALFGLIGATNQICSYKFSAGSKVAGINLKQHWRAAHQSVWKRLEGNYVVDLRSSAYASLAPVPESLPRLAIEVIDSISGKTISHMNKRAKGSLVGELLRQPPSNVRELADVATAANLRLEIDGRRGILFASA